MKLGIKCQKGTWPAMFKGKQCSELSQGDVLPPNWVPGQKKGPPFEGAEDGVGSLH